MQLTIFFIRPWSVQVYLNTTEACVTINPVELDNSKTT